MLRNHLDCEKKKEKGRIHSCVQSSSTRSLLTKNTKKKCSADHRVTTISCPGLKCKQHQKQYRHCVTKLSSWFLTKSKHFVVQTLLNADIVCSVCIYAARAARVNKVSQNMSLHQSIFYSCRKHLMRHTCTRAELTNRLYFEPHILVVAVPLQRCPGKPQRLDLSQAV